MIFGSIFERSVLTKRVRAIGSDLSYDNAMAVNAVVTALHGTEFSFNPINRIISVGSVPFSKLYNVPAFLTPQSPAGKITDADILKWNTPPPSNDSFYVEDGNVTTTRNVNVLGNTLRFFNVGLFRIEEGDANVGGIYDFNGGIDFVVHDTVHSSTIRTLPTTGTVLASKRVSDGATLSSLQTTPQGVKAEGVAEYADNAAAIAAGLTAGYLYRTGDTLKIVH